MRPLEFYVKLHIRRLEDFKQSVREIVSVLRVHTRGLRRCDWFVADDKMEAIAMLAWADHATLQAHCGLARAGMRRLLACCELTVTSLGALSPEALAEPDDLSVRVLHYADGLGLQQGLAAQAAGPPIEIATTFHIQAAKLEIFKQDAAVLTEIVRRNDPGTIRYDWFYDDASLLCCAMDTYRDSEAMFEHMSNCHEAHNKLLVHSTMTTEFLGDLPEAAAAAVAKYHPYIAPFYCGLNRR